MLIAGTDGTRPLNFSNSLFISSCAADVAGVILFVEAAGCCAVCMVAKLGDTFGGEVEEGKAEEDNDEEVEDNGELEDSPDEDTGKLLGEKVELRSFCCMIKLGANKLGWDREASRGGFPFFCFSARRLKFKFRSFDRSGDLGVSVGTLSSLDSNTGEDFDLLSTLGLGSALLQEVEFSEGELLTEYEYEDTFKFNGRWL